MIHTKRLDVTDAEVGRRVRLRRMQLRMSQSELANTLGVSFQQVQKYEKGANRISAGRLQRIADTLKVPVSFFFGPGAGVREENYAVLSFLNTAHALRLLQAYSRIHGKKLKQAVLELVERVAENEER